MTAWSTSNKSGHATLSGSNLTVNGDSSSSNPFSGRADATISGTQKIYDEITANTYSAGIVGSLGYANSSWPMTDGVFGGVDTNALMYYGNGQVFFNNAVIATIQTYTTGSVIGRAIDFALGKVWYTGDGSNYNVGLGGTQNPATGAGGLTLGVTGTVFQAYQVFNAPTDVQYTINNGATALSYTTPSGFSTFDGGDTLMGQAVM